MVNPPKASLIINQKQFTDMISNINRKSFFPIVNGSFLNTGKVGTLWGVDVIVSNVIPRIKRKYNKIIGQYITYRSVKYKILMREDWKYVCECGYNARVPSLKLFTYYQIKKLL